MEKPKFYPTDPENGVKRSDVTLNADRIVQDPGLRRIYLNKTPDAYESLWRQHGVDEESRIKNRGRLLKTINDPNLQRRTAARIISVVLENPGFPDILPTT